MGSEQYGPWEPLPVADAVALFWSAKFRWWLTGGHALDAHLGESWRVHEDTDIGIARADAVHLVDVLPGWDIHVAAAGVLSPWDGNPLDANRSQNNLWCRRSPSSAWALDVTVGDGDDHEWIFRRDASIRRPWTDAVLTTDDDVPYLAPELQLLFKSKNVRPKDDVDARVVLPRLEPGRRGWISQHLPAGHPWQQIASDAASGTSLGESDPVEVAEFWQRFLSFTDRPLDIPQPDAWPFGDSVELADELVDLVLDGTKRATAGSVAEYASEGDPLPKVGDLEIVLDGTMRPRAVLQISEVRIGPLSSVDKAFAYDEGEGDRTRDYWLDAHTAFFRRVLPSLGIAFDADMETIFQRFDVLYHEDGERQA